MVSSPNFVTFSVFFISKLVNTGLNSAVFIKYEALHYYTSEHWSSFVCMFGLFYKKDSLHLLAKLTQEERPVHLLPYIFCYVLKRVLILEYNLSHINVFLSFLARYLKKNLSKSVSWKTCTIKATQYWYFSLITGKDLHRQQVLCHLSHVLYDYRMSKMGKRPVMYLK